MVNKEEFILATFKRLMVKKISQLSVKLGTEYDVRRQLEILQDCLNDLNNIEADAVLGTEELAEEFAEKYLRINEEEK